MFDQNELKSFSYEDINRKDLEELVKSIPNDIKNSLLEEKKASKINLYELFNLLKYVCIGDNIRDDYGILINDCVYAFKQGQKLIDSAKIVNLLEDTKTTKHHKFNTRWTKDCIKFN